MTSVNPDLQLNHTPGHVKHDGHNMTGFVIFLCSESVIFLAFFAGYAVLKLTSPMATGLASKGWRCACR